MQATIFDQEITVPAFIKSEYTVKSIDKIVAARIIIENHYLHTRPLITLSYGLFYKDKLTGILTLGNPTCPRLTRICGIQYAKEMLELNRLYCYDWAPRNSESFFISQVIKLIKQDHPQYKILISYADTGAGHTGLIYQATNWLYTGTSFQGGGNLLIDGKKMHRRNANSVYGTSDIKKLSEMFPEKSISLIKLSTKHRYIKFIGSKKENKDRLNGLKYEILNYPK
jgi:hypothetical protein